MVPAACQAKQCQLAISQKGPTAYQGKRDQPYIRTECIKIEMWAKGLNLLWEQTGWTAFQSNSDQLTLMGK